MKKTLKALGIVIVTLAIVFSMAACPDEADDPAHVHDWGAWQVTTTADCTTAGVETRTCTLDASHTETRPLTALGHHYIWEPTAAATYITEGVETEICSHNTDHKRGTRPIAGSRIPFTYTGNYSYELREYLDGLPANTPETAYIIKLNAPLHMVISTTPILISILIMMINITTCTLTFPAVP